MCVQRILLCAWADCAEHDELGSEVVQLSDDHPTATKSYNDIVTLLRLLAAIKVQ